jgi:hypothetical protein
VVRISVPLIFALRRRSVLSVHDLGLSPTCTAETSRCST